LVVYVASSVCGSADFPYAVVVREQGPEILIIAFAHHARRPGYWLGRLGRPGG